MLTLPDFGVRCAFTPVVNYFYQDFLYPEGQPSLHSGDQITSLGGEEVKTWSDLLRRLLELRDEPPEEAPDDLTADDLRGSRVPPGLTHFKINGQRVVRVDYKKAGDGDKSNGVVWCRLGRAPLDALLPGVLWFCLNIGLFVVGAIVFWKRPEDGPAAQFFLLCLVTLGAFMGGYHWSRIVTHPVLIAVFMACAVLLPAVTLHFYLIFPRPKAFIQSHRLTTLVAVYGPPLVFLLLFLKGYLQVRWLDQGGGTGLLAGVEGALRQEAADPSNSVRLLLLEMLYEIYIYFGLAALWYLGSIASLVHSYRAAANAVERNQVKWILIGSAAALLPLGYTMHMAFWESGRFGGGGATWPMFLASACITLAYTFSITRYRLLELDSMISSGAVLLLVSFLAGLAYYGVVFAGLVLAGSYSGEGPSFTHVFGVSAAALVLMVALDVARGRLMRAVDKHFRREKYQLDRTLQRMSQAIEKLVDPPTLARRLLHTATELLSATSGAIYLRQGDPPLYRLTAAVGPTPPLTELSQGCPLVESLRATGQQSAEASAAGRQLAFLQGVVGQALVHEGELIGLLVLGPRTEGEFTAEEVQLLSALSQMTVLALLSAEGHRTIEALNRELRDKVEKIAEQQRRILALQSQLRQTHQKDEVGRMKDETKTGGPATSDSSLHPSSFTLHPSQSGMIGSSPQVQQLMHLVRRVAASTSAVLLRGESGTGKELLAKALHDSSPRANKAFIKVHCAALSPGLLESELFGHVKGAFTSAIRDKVGRFESADGGTLFLDEIGDISLDVQTKLLRVLEEMTFERVGSSEPVHVDVRIIAATHRDLEGMIAEGKFREDLYFRLNVLPIHVPPLRERAEDVVELARHFLQLYAQKLGKPAREIDDDAMLALRAYPWPGNVRQLENVIERAVVIAEGPTIGLAELPDEVTQTAPEPDEALDSWTGELAAVYHAERAERERREREQLVRALAAAKGNKAEAARALGLARSTLISKLKKFGLS
ncbi:MAG: sigma-54-dependent Fis family transcriptional regulator [Gemmataceae bacterium]